MRAQEFGKVQTGEKHREFGSRYFCGTKQLEFSASGSTKLHRVNKATK